jgi:L-iditol 2-dehydrogenase
LKALILTAYNKFIVDDVAQPTPGPNDVLIAVQACGICGSDVHGMDGSTDRRQPPIIMGHEAAGVIAQIGANVAEWNVGDRVTFDSTIYCGACDFCKAGRVNLCEDRRVLGVSCGDYRQNGAFAEFVVVPQHILYRIPESLPLEHAAMVEPVSVAVHAIRRLALKRGDSAVVIGAGMIGLLAVQVLCARGCETVVAIDVDDSRLALAQELGASEVFNSSREDVVAQVRDLTAGVGADVGIEAVGIDKTVETAIHCVRKGGAVSLIGNVSPRIELPLQSVVTREVTLFGSCASAGEYPECLYLLERGAVRVGPLISAVAPLEDGARWFERLHKREPGLMKVILAPGEKP